MKLSIIETGLFKLDGGAMFGVVPKVMWKKINPPDEQNLCTWAMRCLLVETDDNRRILIDTGMGDKQDAKFRSHFHPHGDTDLMQSLAAKGLQPEEITDVLLTHMHFDHVGGAVRYDGDDLVPTFPNATYWTSETHYNWAMNPNPREAASFLKENIEPLRTAGVLKFIPESKEDVDWIPGIKLRFVYGHTEAMMLPIITHQDRTLVFCADLIPSAGHLGLPYVMSYDLRPLNTMDEKERLLEEALAHQYALCLEHDPSIPCITVTRNERGRIVMKDMVNAEEWLG